MMKFFLYLMMVCSGIVFFGALSVAIADFKGPGRAAIVAFFAAAIAVLSGNALFTP